MTITAIQNSIPASHPIFNDTSIKRANTNYSSSLEQSQEEPPARPGLFSPPILLIMDLMNETYAIGASLLQSASEEIKISSDDLSKKMAENIAALQKASQRAQELGVWSTLQKAGSCVLFTFNLYLGCSLCSNDSQKLGSVLIASGILSITNLAMTELRGWDLMAEKLAGGNEDLKNKITLWSPIALHCLSGALNTAAGASILCDPTLSFDYEKCNQAINIYSGVTSAGKSVADSRFFWTKADLSLIQNSILSDTLLQDALIALIQDFNKSLNYMYEQARNIIQLNSQLRT